MLTPLHVRDICYGGRSGTMCKYLDAVTRSDGKTVQLCTKLNAGAFAALEKKRRHSYWGSVVLADNCPGYLYLQYKEQGYDKK